MIPVFIVVALSLSVVTLLGIVAWFVIRHVWPYTVAQVEINRQQRVRDQDQFLSVLGNYARGAEGTRQMMGQMQQILSLQTDAIQQLANEIKHAPKQKPKAPRVPPKDTRP